MADPAPLAALPQFEPWQCPKDEDRVEPCSSPNNCALTHTENGINVLKYMTTCKVGIAGEREQGRGERVGSGGEVREQGRGSRGRRGRRGERRKQWRGEGARGEGRKWRRGEGAEEKVIGRQEEKYELRKSILRLTCLSIPLSIYVSIVGVS